MKTAALHIKWLCLVLSGLIFVSSTGITVSAHYCASSHTLLKSFLATDLSCQHENSVIEDNCCKEKAIQDVCCQKTEEIVEVQQRCCFDFSHYYKINIDTELPDYKIAFTDCIQPGILPFQAKPVLLQIDKLVQLADVNKAPPHLIGIDLLTSLHQLKIDIDCA